jgi:hypothetical protein
VGSRLAWMVLGADTTSELATAKAAGATHGLVEVFWDQCQSTSGGAVTATAVQAGIQRVLDAGMKVTLRVSLQYIPTFVDTAAVKLRRNGGVDHNPGNVSGNNARDWVWSASTRALVADFLDKLFVQINWAVIDRVQLGGGPAGELQYPDSDGTQWWGFSAPAQTGTDLAAGQTVCPSPGYVPSTGTTWTGTDAAWASWYTQSLTNWMLWLIAKHRVYYSGPIWVMHPGAGLRKVSQTPTGSQALNYRVNVAKGVDWDHQIAAYPDADVHPYSTWADGAHFFPSGAFGDTTDGDAAAWYHLLRVARVRGRAKRLWGENTGGQTNADMDRVFASGAVAYGYEGLGWLSHDSLADGTSDTYANLTARIATANAAVGDYVRGVNMAGGEFAPSAATLPGTVGTDYSYDTAAAFVTIGTRGHRIVRLPFRWERIQPTRGAALNSAELARLTQVVADIRDGRDEGRPRRPQLRPLHQLHRQRRRGAVARRHAADRRLRRPVDPSVHRIQGQSRGRLLRADERAARHAVGGRHVHRDDPLRLGRRHRAGLDRRRRIGRERRVEAAVHAEPVRVGLLSDPQGRRRHRSAALGHRGHPAVGHHPGVGHARQLDSATAVDEHLVRVADRRQHQLHPRRHRRPGVGADRRGRRAGTGDAHVDPDGTTVRHPDRDEQRHRRHVHLRCRRLRAGHRSPAP